jgi:hypothetical protein
MAMPAVSANTAPLKMGRGSLLQLMTYSFAMENTPLEFDVSPPEAIRFIKVGDINCSGPAETSSALCHILKFDLDS